MLGSWKSQFRSLVTDESARRKASGVIASTDINEDPQVLRLRNTLADLKQHDEATDVRDEAAPAPAEVTEEVPAPVPHELEPPQAEADHGEELSPAQRLVAQQRKTAEALLREVCALEGRLKMEAHAAQAAAEYATAKAKADDAARLEREAKAKAHEASERHGALTAERKTAEEMAAAARANAVEAGSKVAALEQELREAQQRLDVARTARDRHESRAKDSAAQETIAAREAAQAADRVASSHAARAAAEKIARAAQEGAEAAKSDLPAGTKSLAGISDVQNLAKRLAEEASALSV